MHGFIHMTLRSLVLSKPQGEAKWAQLLVKIGAIEITFLELRMHPDELTVASVVAAAELLGTDVPGALLAFGHHFVVFMAETNYLSIVLSFGKDLLDFLHNVDEMHKHLQKSPQHTDCHFPHFQARTDADGRLLVSYASLRGALLAPVVEGILISLAANAYMQRVRLERQAITQDGYSATWELHITSAEEAAAQEAEKKQPAMPSGATSPIFPKSRRSDMEIRAASKWHEALAASLVWPAQPQSAPVRLGARVHTLVHRMYRNCADRWAASPTSKARVTPASSEPSIARRAETVASSTAETPAEALAAEVETTPPVPAPPVPHAIDSVGSVMNWVIAHNRVPPPKLSWWGPFEERAAEAQFRRDVLRRALAQASAVFAAVLALAGAAATALLWHGGGLRGSAFALLVLCAGAAAAPALLALSRIARPSALVLAEATSTLLLCALCVGSSLLVPAAVSANGGIDPAEALATEMLVLVTPCALLLAAAMLTPVQPRAFVIASIVAAVAVGVSRASRRGSAEIAHTERLSAVLLGALLLACCAHLSASARTQRLLYHASRIIIDGMPEWRNVKQQELETYLRASQAEAGVAARAKLIRVVMHDLRSPLLTIRNIGDCLADDGTSSLASDGVRFQIDALRTCVTTMENIMSDMLDFERIDSGRLVLVHRAFKLSTLVYGVQTVFRSQAEAKKVELRFEPIPQSLTAVRFTGDVRRLHQCLSNGVSNALKFTDPNGSVVVSVFESAHAREGWARVHIRVIDSGIGLNQEELSTLREGGVFQQVGRGQLQGRGGTGLGLNIARHILRQHNDSELALASSGHLKGTVFEMRLNMPIASANASSATHSSGVGLSRRASALQRGSDAAAEAPSPPAQRKHGWRKSAPDPQLPPSGSSSVQRATAHPPVEGERLARAAAAEERVSNAVLELVATADSDGEGGADEGDPSMRSAHSAFEPGRPREPADVHCLHVEDDALLQFTIGTRIRMLGVTLDVAANGQEALDMLAERVAANRPAYDLVVMDNQMPSMCGADATRELRVRGFEGRILGMTGDPAGSPDRLDFENAGLDECVDKTTEGMRAIEAMLTALIRGESASNASGGTRERERRAARGAA